MEDIGQEVWEAESVVILGEYSLVVAWDTSINFCVSRVWLRGSGPVFVDGRQRHSRGYCDGCAAEKIKQLYM